MSVPLEFRSVPLGLFKFEPFSFEWDLASAASFRVTASPFVRDNITVGSSVVFSSAVGYGLTTAGETIVIEALNGSGAVLGVSSNTVSVGPARFVTDASGTALEGQRFVFHKGEPITPVTVTASFTLATPPTSTPTLPNGLAFSPSSASATYTLSGTPTVQTPINTYSIVGSNVGSTKVARSIVSIAVNAERVILDLSGTGLTSLMVPGTPITPQVLTARYPPYPIVTPNLRYTFTPLPGGLEFANAAGTAQSSPFTPSDTSSTLVLRGTPSLAGARQFADLGISSAEVLVTATRTIQPLISNSQSFTVSFAEAVLFDDRVFDTFYSGVAVDPSRNFVRAQTFFGGVNRGITSIVSSDLRADLSLNFVASEGRAYLVGTPTTVASNQFTLRATNSNATVGTALVSVVVAEDVVTLTPPTDVCYNFVLSRSASSALTGYYPAPLTWRATAASGRAIGFTAPALAGTGLTLDVLGGSATLSGIPDTITSLRTLRVTASAIGSPATAFRDSSFAVVPDVFTFTAIPAQTVIQNREMTPVQVTAATLSQRLITAYSATSLPAGLSISTSGLLSGTATGGTSTATITASTGYASASTSLPVTVIVDDALIATASGIDSIGPVFSGIDVRGITYSGIPGTLSLDLSGLIPYQGAPRISLTMTPQGALSGDITTATRPFPGYSVPVRVAAGPLNASVRLSIALSNTPIPYHVALIESNASAGTSVPYTPPLSEYQVWTNPTYAYRAVGASNEAQFDPAVRDFIKTSPTDCNITGYGDLAQSPTAVILGAGSSMYRSTNGGQQWSTVSTPTTFAGPRITIPGVGGPPTTFTFPSPLVLCLTSDNTSNWLALCAGSTPAGAPITIVRQSANDGVTWTDTSLALITRSPSTPALDTLSSNTRLFYNQGRYFLAQETSALNDSLYYASESDVASSWTASDALTGGRGVALSMAFSGSTAIVGGSDYGSNVFRSTTNGTSWTPITDARFNDAAGVIDGVFFSNTAAVAAATHGDGLFTIAVNANGIRDSTSFTDNFIYQSADGLTWTRFGNPVGSSATSNGAIAYDENALWVANNTANQWSIRRVQPDLSDSVLIVDVSDGVPVVPLPMPDRPTKRLLVHPVSRGAVAGTIQIVRDPLVNLGQFVSPGQTLYTFSQFCPIEPIVAQVSQTSPEFVYYYVSGLPDGLASTVTGSSVTLSGRPVTYSDAFQRTVFFARQNADTLALPILTRTVLPTITKQQTSASGHTSVVRQYTEVNAARNAENNVVYPAESRGIGEFTRPTPPNEITQTVDPKCFGGENCR